MSRREFIGLVTLLGAAELTPPAFSAPLPASRYFKPIRGICFDLFTIFDPRSVALAANAVVPGRGLELWNVWKTRQFEYAWLRAAAGKYSDFEVVTGDALSYAARELKISLTVDQHRQLVDSYSELEPWADARGALLAWKEAGLKLAPLANYSPKMLGRLLQRSQLDRLFDVQISTDRARTYKPDPRAYALGPSLLGLPREQLAFAAFGGWDAAGSKWFGLPTFWVNRLGVTVEQLVAPDGSGPGFSALANWVTGRGHSEARK
ncbi:MAG: haloacid dehalogenase type II [Polyangiaceae bacterium]